jgi:hypothetical protein
MDKHYSLTETAGLIRKALKESFPDTKFSVTTKRYTGGSSISIFYTNGPLTKDVSAIAKLFEGAGFDGMTDSTYFYKACSFRGELATFNYGYVFVSRSVCDAVLQIAAYRVHKETKLPLLTLKNGSFINGEYQTEFSYMKELDVFARDEGPAKSGEWYAQLVMQVAWNTATPHKRGETELPQVVDIRLRELNVDSVASVN